MQFWPQVSHHGLRVKEIPVRLIYNDPTRHFGGKLDDACVRLRHYLDVLRDELARLNLKGKSKLLAAARQSAAVRLGCGEEPMPEKADVAAAPCCCGE
jgi:hypothetical protein